MKVKIPKPTLIDITKLVRHPNNLKKHTESQITTLTKLIKMVGFKDPIVIDKKFNVKAGHGRLDVAEKLEMQQVPCIYIEGLTQKQMDLFMWLDNHVNESPWIQDNIDLIFEDMPLIDLEQFPEINWDDVIPQEIQEEPIPELPKEPKSKLGDIYQLGDHRVMCGDSTKDLNKLLLETKIDLLLTDPPYGIDIVHGGNSDISANVGFVGIEDKPKSSLAKARKYKSIIADDKPFEPQFLLKYGKTQIIFGANHFANKLPNNSHWLVWDKKIEGGLDHNNFSDVELMWTNVNKKSALIYRHLWSGLLRAGDRKTELTERVHPTQKPVGLLSNIIKDYSEKNNTVLDCYLGSGSTLIACEHTNRICYGMEIDPGYVDVIIERFINFKDSDDDVYLIRDNKKIKWRDL